MGSDISQHRRLAMGEKIDGQALKKGGTVKKKKAGGPIGPVGPSVIKIAKVPLNPVVAAKRNNGIPGMKSGGAVSDEKQDRKLVKKMVKKDSLTGKKSGGRIC